MRDYELTWILKDKMDDQAKEGSLESVKSLVSDLKGESVIVTDYGMRNLSYEIKGSKRGHYYMIRFSLDPSNAQELENKIYADRNIIRHLMIIINRFDAPISREKIDDAPIFKKPSKQKTEISSVKD